MAFASLTSMSHDKLNRYATLAAVIIAGILVAGKLVAWGVTNSLSIQASLIDSMLDIGASIINFFAVKHAARPPDKEHRFGHGKLEAIASLGQSIFIGASALWLVFDCIQRLYRPETVGANALGTYVMIGAVLLTLALILFQRFVYTRTKSLAIKSDALHYQTDFLTSAAVLVSLNISSYMDAAFVDSIIGGAIAFYIGKTSLSLFRTALDELMDRELPEEMRERIKKIVRGHPDVLDFHELRTRSSGTSHFIQMHLELDPTLSLLRAHDIAVAVENALAEAFPEAEILIHQDPAGHDEHHATVS